VVLFMPGGIAQAGRLVLDRLRRKETPP